MRPAEKQTTVADNYPALTHNRIEEQTGREREPAWKTRVAHISERWMLPTLPSIRQHALTTK
jgi:hypothetical protein